MKNYSLAVAVASIVVLLSFPAFAGSISGQGTGDTSITIPESALFNDIFDILNTVNSNVNLSQLVQCSSGVCAVTLNTNGGTSTLASLILGFDNDWDRKRKRAVPEGGSGCSYVVLAGLVIGAGIVSSRLRRPRIA
jgi:hypothetical protein